MALIYGIINLNAFIIHSDSVFNETVTLIIVKKPNAFQMPKLFYDDTVMFLHMVCWEISHCVLLATILKKENKKTKTPPAPHNTAGLNLYMHVLALTFE